MGVEEMREEPASAARMVGEARVDTAPEQPAGPQPGRLLSHPTQAVRRSQRRRMWRLTFTLLSVAAVAASALLLALPVPPAQPVRPAVVLVVPRGDGIECTRDAEWAPDSTRLVVLGYTQGCPDTPSSDASGHAGLVLVYNALTGVLISRVRPDVLIARATNMPAESIIEYRAALWSPDSTRLAVSFSLASGSSRLEGIYLCDADGGHATVLTRLVAPGDNGAGRWDLQAGAYLPAVQGMPPALGYQWQPDGNLVATAPLSATSAPAVWSSGAIGSPDGSASFSIWQPAEVRLRALGNMTHQATSGGVYVLSTSFVVWSPDGRYLIPNAGAEARLAFASVPTQAQATLAMLGLDTVPLLPVRDRALRIALDRLGARAPDQRGTTPMLLAWSPDGRMLAIQLVLSETGQMPDATHHALLIYDCATGKAIAALVPDTEDTPTQGLTSVRWSPDGTRIFLVDNALGTLTIFGPGKVPRR